MFEQARGGLRADAGHARDVVDGIAGEAEIVGDLVRVHAVARLAAMGALHASEMYARNVYNFLALMLGKDGELKLDWEDELLAKTCLTRDGQLAAA